MWGIIPAAGAGSRIQPLACSKELLPVGKRVEGNIERPKAVSEYLVDRMILGGADKLCFVISPGKSDILEYYSGRHPGVDVLYVVQPRPLGLCDALFRTEPLIPPDEEVLVGLPDTVWFPEDAYCALNNGTLTFLLFPVERPELFDAVITDDDGRVLEIRVKSREPRTSWIWGGFKLRGSTFRELSELWIARGRQDEYLGTLVNAYIANGGQARAIRAGQTYLDVGTVEGFRKAVDLLAGPAEPMGLRAPEADRTETQGDEPPRGDDQTRALAGADA
jgi:glucose-1-phosphate thymidylyltransferase